MSLSERREMIREKNTKLSLIRQSKLLRISRSSLYYTPVDVNTETFELINEIDRVFTKYPFFGSRQIAAYLPQSGFSAGWHRVRRLTALWDCRPYTRGQTPARSTHSTTFTVPAENAGNHATQSGFV
ncbi:hypothetical protein ABM428_17370 (plasmid) [Sulfitobacter sp. TCYB15]|uniref:Transposase n=1 Tax=Sulfitobacter sp. TCYB15 TaxID=3229275 RepID=A0AAU8C834_9RHOB